MSFFQKLKKDIGIEEEPSISLAEKKAEKNKKKPKKKENKEKPKKEAKDWLKVEGQLAVDVYQSENEFCIQAPIAGVEAEDIDISIENEMLIIKGERKEPEKEREKNYFYQECYWGPFSRQIILPEDVDTQRIKAYLRKGILTIKIPRVRKIKKKKITIQTAD
ncbi:Hsp20/alpha crystallin family protein [bacterium]|nr:Hsp20/alpha crystallin family protein [bacterium]